MRSRTPVLIGGLAFFSGLFTVALVTAAFFAAPADAQQQVGIGPFEEVSVDLSGDPQDDDDTTVRVKNLTNQAGTVVVDFDPKQGPGQQDTVAPGFALIDGTLTVSSDLPPGQLRARYRVEADGRALQRAGIRAGRARLMRLDEQNARWRPAIRALRGRATVRYLRDARADFVLGHHGASLADGYVWAVLDVNSHYAAGGSTIAAVPALAPRALVMLGAALLGAAAIVLAFGTLARRSREGA